MEPITRAPTNVPFFLAVAVGLISGYVVMSSGTSFADNSGGALAFLMFIGTLFYFLPSILAYKYSAEPRGVIFLLNALFGATVIMWIVCIIWAASARRVPVVVHESEGPIAPSIFDRKRP